MMVCFMAAVMMMSVGCDKESISPIIPDGALPGLFSVSATKQVHFSQGNLQYQASTNTWRFAEHQYDYVGTQTADRYGYYGGNVSGSDNRSISSTYSGWIDLFGWGTGSNPTLSSPSFEDISSTYSGWIDLFGWGTGSNPTLSSPSFEDYGTFMDWGCNAIINGGNTVNQWRTLTIAEWNYLLNTRTDASSKRGTGNINGVGGLIILPDSWTLPSECAFTSGFAPDWTHNSYTLAQWAQMEAAGAVFLPAAGHRFGTDVGFVGNWGWYWSSSPFFHVSAAYYMKFDSGQLGATYNSDRQGGFSVRPVQDN